MIAPLTVRAVNNHDSLLFDRSFSNLLDVADLLDLEIKDSFLTLDSGFDAEANKVTIRNNGLIPVIKLNPRGVKDLAKLHQKFEEFDLVKDIYKERYKIERSFAWEDIYRKLVIRYEKLQATHLGFKYLAFSMINLRWFIGKK